MGGRVVDRARLESVFTFIGNEGSNPSPSGFTSFTGSKVTLERKAFRFITTPHSPAPVTPLSQAEEFTASLG